VILGLNSQPISAITPRAIIDMISRFNVIPFYFCKDRQFLVKDLLFGSFKHFLNSYSAFYQMFSLQIVLIWHIK
jgi:hypothetical protein